MSRYPPQSRRGPGPMIAPPHAQQQPQMSQADMQRQMVEQQRRVEQARRQSRKPTDRDIPDELAEVVVGDGVERYKNLRDTERRLDALMMRKRLDVMDNLQRRYTRREGVLRVCISNTAEAQPWQVMEEGGIGLGEDATFDFGETGHAVYRVKMEGRVLDDSDDAAADEQDKEGKKPAKRARLSHFFRAITIDFDRSTTLQPDACSQIEWRKPTTADSSSSEANFDSLEFERKSDENLNVTINLVRDEKYDRFTLSPELVEILDTEEDDRAGVLQGIWEYCRAMGLQEEEDKRRIVCDEPLRKVFHAENLYFPYVPEMLTAHLHPLPPIKLQYTIRVDKPYIVGDGATPASAPTIYDVRVPLPNALQTTLTQFQRSQTHLHGLSTIVNTDNQLALLVQKLHHTNAKRKFYDSLARDPAAFVRRWCTSQQRDLETVLAEATRGGGRPEDFAEGVWRRGGTEGVWGQQGARESVGLWLARGGDKGQKAH